jgi:rhodanese-related sulfurtransferase
MDQFLEFTGNHPVLVVALMISFFVLIFSELRRKAAGLTSVDPTSAVGLINDDAIIVDLRTAEAFSRGHIANAKNLPFDQFEAKRDAMLGNKSRPVLAVCDSGVSSNKAAGALSKSGFESVFSLKGGMNAWTQAGLPVVTGKKTKSKK